MYERVASNQRRSVALLAGFALFVLLIGWLFGYIFGWGIIGLVVAVVVTLVMTIGSYFGSDRIALSMSRARPAEPEEFPQLHNVVEALCIGLGMPKPRLYVVDDLAPNAFATGRNPEHAAVAVTTGLLDKLNRDELEGVLAHELSHVKNRDILVMTLAVTLVGVAVLLSDFMIRAMFWGRLGGGMGGGRGGGGGKGNAGIIIAVIGIVLLIVAPIVAQVLKFAISRQREFLADADAVLLTRYPPGLIGALEKLRDDTAVVKTGSRATAHIWFEEPIPRREHEGGTQTGKSGAWLNRLFQTHPPLDERIAVLRRSEVTGGTYGPPPGEPPTQA